MGFMGHCLKNKWCCFCRHWYDPTNSAIKPKGLLKNLYDVDDKCILRCTKHNLKTRALGTCKDFDRKF